MQEKEAITGEDTIEFCQLERAYGQFSNFYKAEVLIDDKTWPTTEHYFQAQKFVGK